MDIKKEISAKIEDEKKKHSVDVSSSVPEIPTPLTWEGSSVSRFLENDPPERRYLLEKLLVKGIVGEISATGGTGKSFFLLQLAASMATGKSFSVFRPVGMSKVLYIGCEDPEEELHRRINSFAKNRGLIDSKDLKNNLAAYSSYGKIGALLMLDGKGNPTTSAYYEWLEDTIKQLSGLEVLILDPKSRLYGLEENSNEDNTFWVYCLERLAHDYDLTILFAHHVSKASSQARDIREITGRGGGSLRDSCRWEVIMREMTEDDANKYAVNANEYVELDIGKANYTSKLPNSIFFKRGIDGLLEPTNFNMERIKDLTEALISELGRSDMPVSKRDLLKNLGDGKGICSSLKKDHGMNHSRDIRNVINYALRESLIYEKEVDSGKVGQRKIALKVGQIPF